MCVTYQRLTEKGSLMNDGHGSMRFMSINRISRATTKSATSSWSINFIHVVIISSMRQNHYYFQQWCTFNFADKNLFNAEESIFFSSLTDHCSLSVCWEILKQNPLRNCCPLVIYDSEKTHVVTTSKPRLIDKGLANPRTLYPIPNFTTEKNGSDSNWESQNHFNWNYPDGAFDLLR